MLKCIPVFLLLETPLLTSSDLLCLVYSSVAYDDLFASIINTAQLEQSLLLGRHPTGTRQSREWSAALAAASLWW